MSTFCTSNVTFMVRSKQAKYLVGKLTDIGFKQSMVDKTVIFCGNVIYALYTDDSILASPDDNELNKVLCNMKSTGLELTKEGNLSDFLGVNIGRKVDGTIHLMQPQLIDQILHDLQLEGENVSMKQMPAMASQILKRNIQGECHDDSFHYRLVIGRLNYLEKCTRLDISCAVHQCMHFSADPKWAHANAVRWIGRYLVATRDKGLILKLSGNSFDVYVDSDFSGNWDPEGAPDDPDTAWSRTGIYH